MIATARTFALEGIESTPVIVEVDVRSGLPAFAIVGLPDRAVREARERVRAALGNSDFQFPQQRVTVNLAPAFLHKAGPSFDLAIAVAVLAADGKLPERDVREAVCGELSLSGEIKPVRGALSMALAARAQGIARIVVPPQNAAEAALVDGVEVVAVPDLTRLMGLLRGEYEVEPAVASAAPVARREGPDLSEVRGQSDARRALELAAAGGHNLLMIGPPGAGKTMLARRLPSILPAPSLGEAIEITKVHSAAGLSAGGLVTERPFRAPHHTVSPSGLAGGGVPPKAGEITLAHFGVLFLDELPEFGRASLEALRQPLEEGTVTVVRAQRSVTYPARAMLIAACNGCPCARPPSACTCNEVDRVRYARRLSGPLLDRLDLVCELGPAPPPVFAADAPPVESSEQVRARVVGARERQAARFAGDPIEFNAAMDARLTRDRIALTPPAARAAEQLVRLSGRGQDRVLRLAQTIADLDGQADVSLDHLEEAVGYRMADPLAVAA